MQNTIESSEQPILPTVGQLWNDVGVEPPVLRRWTGECWENVNMNIEQLDPIAFRTIKDKINNIFNDVITGKNQIDEALKNAQNALNKIDETVKDVDSINKQIQTANESIRDIQNMEGSNKLIDTVNGSAQQIEDTTGKLNQVVHTVDKNSSTLTDMETLVSQNTQTLEGFKQTIASADGKINEIEDTLDKHTQLISDVGGRISQAEQTVDGFKQTVSGIEGTMEDMQNSIGIPKNEITTTQMWKMWNADNEESEEIDGWQRLYQYQDRELLPTPDQWFDVKQGQLLTQSIHIRTDGTLLGAEMTFFTWSDYVHRQTVADIFKVDEHEYMIRAEWTPEADDSLRLADIWRVNVEGGSYVEFNYPRLVKGEDTDLRELADKVENNSKQLQSVQTEVNQTSDKVDIIASTDGDAKSYLHLGADGSVVVGADKKLIINANTEVTDGFTLKADRIQGSSLSGKNMELNLDDGYIKSEEDGRSLFIQDGVVSFDIGNERGEQYGMLADSMRMRVGQLYSAPTSESRTLDASNPFKGIELTDVYSTFANNGCILSYNAGFAHLHGDMELYLSNDKISVSLTELVNREVTLWENSSGDRLLNKVDLVESIHTFKRVRVTATFAETTQQFIGYVNAKEGVSSDILMTISNVLDDLSGIEVQKTRIRFVNKTAQVVGGNIARMRGSSMDNDHASWMYILRIEGLNY